MKIKTSEATIEEISKARMALSSGETEVIKAIERNISKPGFDTGIRGMYIARKDLFDFINVASLAGVMRQYNALNLNGFKPIKTTTIDYFLKKLRGRKLKMEMLDSYRKRSYFYMPFRRTRSSMILSTEELATVYHFPGRVAETPTFARIESRKGEPPPTLPI